MTILYYSREIRHWHPLPVAPSPCVCWVLGARHAAACGACCVLLGGFVVYMTRRVIKNRRKKSPPGRIRRSPPNLGFFFFFSATQNALFFSAIIIENRHFRRSLTEAEPKHLLYFGFTASAKVVTAKKRNTAYRRNITAAWHYRRKVIAIFWFHRRLRQSRYRQKTKNRLPSKNYRAVLHYRLACVRVKKRYRQ